MRKDASRSRVWRPTIASPSHCIGSHSSVIAPSGPGNDSECGPPRAAGRRGRRRPRPRTPAPWLRDQPRVAAARCVVCGQATLLNGLSSRARRCARLPGPAPPATAAASKTPAEINAARRGGATVQRRGKIDPLDLRGGLGNDRPAQGGRPCNRIVVRLPQELNRAQQTVAQGGKMPLQSPRQFDVAKRAPPAARAARDNTSIPRPPAAQASRGCGCLDPGNGSIVAQPEHA